MLVFEKYYRWFPRGSSLKIIQTALLPISHILICFLNYFLSCTWCSLVIWLLFDLLICPLSYYISIKMSFLCYGLLELLYVTWSHSPSCRLESWVSWAWIVLSRVATRFPLSFFTLSNSLYSPSSPIWISQSSTTLFTMPIFYIGPRLY